MQLSYVECVDVSRCNELLRRLEGIVAFVVVKGGVVGKDVVVVNVVVKTFCRSNGVTSGGTASVLLCYDICML